MGEIKKDYGFLDDYCDEVYPVTHFYEKEPLKTSVVLIPYQDSIIRERNWAKEILLVLSLLLIVFVITLSTVAANWDQNEYNNTSTPCDREGLLSLCRERAKHLEKRIKELEEAQKKNHPSERSERSPLSHDGESDELALLKKKLEACQNSIDSVAQEMLTMLTKLDSKIQSFEGNRDTPHTQIVNLSNGSTFINIQGNNVSNGSHITVKEAAREKFLTASFFVFVVFHAFNL